MRGMNSASVDLIYLDPPFNSKRHYAAPIGSPAAGAEFKDVWTFDDVDRVWLGLTRERNPALYSVVNAALLAHGKGMAAYLGMMAQRLQEMQRLLKPTGSIYLHCDPTASHYLKMMLDSLFGMKRCQNEVVWAYRTGGASPKRFARKHDILLCYGDERRRTFNPQKEKAYTKAKGRKPGKTNYGAGEAEFFEDEGGVYNLVTMRDVWNIPYVNSQARERTGYPTQKPEKLLRRVIRSSSNEGDVVFDPFAGCATTCVAAEQLRRQWVGIDISHKAAELVVDRLDWAVYEYSGVQPQRPDVVHRTDLPQRTDLGKLPHYTAHKDTLYGESGGYCGGCGVHFEKRNLEIDHIVPQSKGGTDHMENLWLLCGACNRSKGTKSQAEFVATRMGKKGSGMQWLDQ